MKGESEYWCLKFYPWLSVYLFSIHRHAYGKIHIVKLEMGWKAWAFHLSVGILNEDGARYEN